MTITRKYYETIARIFSKHTEGCYSCGDMGLTVDLINELGEYLKSDNPNFDMATFTKACGPKWICERCGRAVLKMYEETNGLCYECWDLLIKGDLL